MITDEALLRGAELRNFWRASSALSEAARAGMFDGESVSAELNELAAIALNSQRPRLREAARRRMAEHPCREAGELLDYVTSQVV